MASREEYAPGSPRGAEIQKDGDNWTLVIVRDLRHPPEKVWTALTDPAHLREWAPFDADGNLGTMGAQVNLTTVGAPKPVVTETVVTLAARPNFLEFKWGDIDLRWALEATAQGTRLTLWTKIDRRYIAMGAAGWHICFDVLDNYLAEAPIGRMVGPDAIKFGGWSKLYAEYAQQFGLEIPKG